MKSFLVIACDAKDNECAQRRERSRVPHFERVAPFVEAGQILAGGGMLSDDGRVTGSAFFATFESQEDLQDWLNDDPLTVNGVWEKFEIIPMKIVVKDSKLTV